MDEWTGCEVVEDRGEYFASVVWTPFEGIEKGPCDPACWVSVHTEAGAEVGHPLMQLDFGPLDECRLHSLSDAEVAVRILEEMAVCARRLLEEYKAGKGDSDA